MLLILVKYVKPKLESSVFALPFKVKDDDGELKDKRGSPPLPFSASVTSRAGNPRSSD